MSYSAILNLLSFPKNLGTKSLVRAILQGRSPRRRLSKGGRGSFLEEA